MDFLSDDFIAKIIVGGITGAILSIVLSRKKKAIISNPDSTILIQTVEARDIKSAIRIVKEFPELIDAKNIAGESPLHVAVKEKAFEMVHLLIANKADLSSTRNDGLTPLELAEKMKWKSGLDLFKKLET
jgi:hypothetical protein